MITNDNNYVIFKVNDFLCAISCLDVHEIIRDTKKLTSIPQSPDYISGVINLRGKIVSILNLSVYFDLDYTPSETDSIIIVNEDEELIGLMVSEVKDVMDISNVDLENTPTVPHKMNPFFIKNVLQLESGIVAVLNTKEILKIELNETEIKG